MKNIKNSAVAEKSLAAHRLLKIKSTEDKSYQISAENCLRKRDWYGLVHFSQRKLCGNAAETRNATSFCSYVFPPSGNVTETWTIRFPQDFRNTETPYFTLCSSTSGNFSFCSLSDSSNARSLVLALTISRSICNCSSAAWVRFFLLARSVLPLTRRLWLFLSYERTAKSVTTVT